MENWSKNELFAYLLIYCMNANFDEDTHEIAYIKEQIGSDVYNKMMGQFELDKDYQRIQKIQANLESLNMSKIEKEEIVKSMKELFLSDGKFDQIEKVIFMSLKHIL